jgi:hypothetical protein
MKSVSEKKKNQKNDAGTGKHKIKKYRLLSFSEQF